MLSVFFFLTMYMQNFLGFDALAAGVRFLPLSGMILVAAPLGGVLIDRIGPRPVLVLGMVLSTISVILMTRISPHDVQRDWVVLLPAFIIGGLGMGFAQPTISTVAVGTVSKALAGMASGVNGMCRQIGSSFGIAFLGAMLSSHYNGRIASRLGGLTGLPTANKAPAIHLVQQAGTVAGSLGLPIDPRQPVPLAHSPAFPLVQQIARQSFVDSTVYVLWLAAGILVIGTVAAATMIRRQDLVQAQATVVATAA
jgi:MFS family permease